MSLCPLFWTRFNKTREVQICPESESGFFPFLPFAGKDSVEPSSLSAYLSAITFTDAVTWQEYEGTETLPEIDSFRHATTGAEGWAEIRRTFDGGIGGAVYVYEAPIAGPDIPVIIEFRDGIGDVLVIEDTSLAWNEGDQRYDSVSRTLGPSVGVARIRVFTTTPGIRFAMHFILPPPF